MFRRHSTVAHLYLKKCDMFLLTTWETILTKRASGSSFGTLLQSPAHAPMLTKHFGTHPRSSNLFNEATYDSCRTKSISEFESCSHRVRKQRICVQTNCYHARIVSSTRIFMTYSQLTKKTLEDTQSGSKIHARKENSTLLHSFKTYHHGKFSGSHARRL